jgi:hypothetical protein
VIGEEELQLKYQNLLIRYLDLKVENDKLKHQIELLNALGVSIEKEREDKTNAS